MIISREHRYLFVEFPLTGSTAIAAELCAHYGGEPVVYKHARLSALREDISGYLLVVGVRHPLDRLVSTYEKYRGGHNSDEAMLAWNEAGKEHVARARWIRETDASFADYVKRYNSAWSARIPEMYTMGRPADHVIRFERLNSDFHALLYRLGLQPVRDLPVANKTAARNAEFTSYYQNGLGLLVAGAYGPWCEYWGYDIGFLKAEIPAVSRRVFKAKMAIKTLL